MFLVYIFSRQETPFTENVVPPEPNSLNLYGICLKKAYIHSNRFFTTARSLRRILQPEEGLRDERYKIARRHLLANLKNVRVLAPPMLFNIELRRQCQPIAYRPVQASNRALRSVKHERPDIVLGVRCCRMTSTPYPSYFITFVYRL